MLKSSTVIGGVSPVYVRAESDFYATPPECTVALANAFGELLPAPVWEPACGDGAISKVLEQQGLTVYSTDLRDTGYGAGGIDALTFVPHGVKSAITNPPFSLAVEFINRLRLLHIPFALLLKSTFWHAKSRADLFRTSAPYAVCPMLWRPNFAPDRGTSPTMDVCWTVWGDKPYPGDCLYIPLHKPESI